MWNCQTSAIGPKPSGSSSPTGSIRSSLRSGPACPPNQSSPRSSASRVRRVRDALARSSREGLVRRVQGSGTYVAAPPRVAEQPRHELRRHRRDPRRGDAGRASSRRGTGSRLRRRARPERLALGPGEDVLVIDRVRTADDGRSCSRGTSSAASLIEDRGGGSSRCSTARCTTCSSEEHGITLEYGIASFPPGRPDRSARRGLGVKPGRAAPVPAAGRLRPRRRSPVLLSHEYHLGDAFEFSVVRRGPGRRLR